MNTLDHDHTHSTCSSMTEQVNTPLRQAQLKMFAMLQEVDKICQRHRLDYWLEAGTLLGAIRHQGFIPWDDDLDISLPRESYIKFLQVAQDELPSHLFLQTPESDPGFFNLSVPLKIRDKSSRFVEIHEQGNEPYQQGIFIDVFTYDQYSSNSTKRKLSKLMAKKILRLLQHKYCSIEMGHYNGLYRALSQVFSKKLLLSWQEALVQQSKHSKNNYLGYGYNSVMRNLVSSTDIYPLRKARFETGEFFIPNQAERILEQYYGDYMTFPPEHQRVQKHLRELVPNL